MTSITKKFLDLFKRKLSLKLILNIVVGVFLTASLTAVFIINYTFGYNVVLSGKNIGNVYAKSDVDKTIDKINEQYSPYFSGEDAIYDNPVYTLRILKRNEITDLKNIEENIKASSAQMVKQNVIVVDGIDVVGLYSKEAAQSVLDDYKNQFAGNDENEVVSFENDVKIEEKYSPAYLLMSEHNAMHHLAGEYSYSYLPTLKVSVSTYETVQTEIPFETSKKDDTSIYEGVEKVDVEGQSGLKETVIKTVKINGDVVSESVVSEKVEKEPVTQVLRVGTKERPSGVGTGKFLLPYSGTITSRFGTRWSRQHSGVDISGSVGSAIYAADDGIVEFAGWDSSGYGNLVKINHNNGYVTYYAHLNSINVNVGDPVKKGNVIASLGNTGRSTGPHLHFEIRKDGNPLDPLSFTE